MIRPAVSGDIAALVALIRAFAECEGLTHELVLDESRLGENLFGAQPQAEALLAEDGDGGTAVGFALFFAKYSTLLGRPGLYLEDLFVAAEHRGQGHGRALLSHVARIAEGRGAAKLEWSVLDHNAPAIAFYRSLGAIAMDDRTTYRLAGDALATLAERANGPG